MVFTLVSSSQVLGECVATYSSRLAVARSFISRGSVALSWPGIYLVYLVPLTWCTKVVYGIWYAVSVLVTCTRNTQLLSLWETKAHTTLIFTLSFLVGQPYSLGSPNVYSAIWHRRQFMRIFHWFWQAQGAAHHRAVLETSRGTIEGDLCWKRHTLMKQVPSLSHPRKRTKHNCMSLGSVHVIGRCEPHTQETMNLETSSFETHWNWSPLDGLAISEPGSLTEPHDLPECCTWWDPFWPKSWILTIIITESAPVWTSLLAESTLFCPEPKLNVKLSFVDTSQRRSARSVPRQGKQMPTTTRKTLHCSCTGGSWLIQTNNTK